MKEYKVEITFYDCGVPVVQSFNKECSTFEELKQAFLKRFGNINTMPNSASRDKKKVKELSRNAKTVEEWVQSVNMKTRWTLNVRILGHQNI